jgi:hypothetical protein
LRHSIARGRVLEKTRQSLCRRLPGHAWQNRLRGNAAALTPKAASAKQTGGSGAERQ